MVARTTINDRPVFYDEGRKVWIYEDSNTLINFDTLTPNQIHSFVFENGDVVIRTVYGLKGTITARADHLHGCNRYFVVPKIGDDGKLPDGYWFDEEDLTKVGRIDDQVNNGRGGFPSKTK